MANYTLVNLMPKFIMSKDKHSPRGYYASKEIMYINAGAFVVPKASPLYASIK